MKQIETQRLLLRPMTVEDAEDVFQWVGDSVVNRYMRYNLYTNVEDVKKWIASVPEAYNQFAFVLKEENKVIGAGSVSFDPDRNGFELGYNLNRDYWGKGYATEASKAMLTWANKALGATHFYATHAIANTASGNVIRKCGFQFTHYGQYSRFDGSETFDAAFYELELE